MNLRDKMLAVIDDVNGSVAERGELVEMIAIALLTRKNLFVLGDPGQAKSYAINLFRQHITGARQFERLLSKQTDEEQLFGRVDLSSLIPGSIPNSALEGDDVYRNLRFDLKCAVDGLGQMKNAQDTFAMLDRASDKLAAYRKAVALLRPSEPVVQTVGKIPEADIVLLDEIFKCNDGVLNSLLTALNERKYTNEGHTYPIPTISFFAASNEIPNFNDPQEKILEALYDRLEMKVVTVNIEDRDTRLAVLKNKQSGAFGQVSATITLEELIEMQREVAAIPVPDSANELADDVLCELRKSMSVSDRKYLGYYPIAQAKAWLSGHDKVESSDLLALKDYLWRLPADRERWIAFSRGFASTLCRKRSTAFVRWHWTRRRNFRKPAAIATAQISPVRRSSSCAENWCGSTRSNASSALPHSRTVKWLWWTAYLMTLRTSAAGHMKKPDSPTRRSLRSRR